MKRKLYSIQQKDRVSGAWQAVPGAERISLGLAIGCALKAKWLRQQAVPAIRVVDNESGSVFVEYLARKQGY